MRLRSGISKQDRLEISRSCMKKTKKQKIGDRPNERSPLINLVSPLEEAYETVEMILGLD